jgi:redox-sensitive bicupin YhaK (pirin superfamily)
VSGALAHQDSMKNKELIKRGDVQFTSAGSGIYHSEFNGSDEDWVHFLQVWIEPRQDGLKPSYTTKHFSDEEKNNQLRLIIAPNVSILDQIRMTGKTHLLIHNIIQSDERAIKVNQDSKVYASILEKGNKVSYKLPATRYGYLHLIQSKNNSAVKLNGVELKEGDGAFIEKATEDIVIESTGQGPAEFLLFDLY